MKEYRMVELYLRTQYSRRWLWSHVELYVERDISDCITLAVQTRKNIYP